MEKELARMKSMLGGSASIKSAKKEKRAVNPDAKPNPWITFLGKVHAALKGAEHKGPATIGVLFASHLKESHGKDAAYEMDSGSMLAEFDAWATEERLAEIKGMKRGTAKKDAVSVSASEGEDSATAKKERKPRAPLTDEQKAARKEKMAAKKASAAAEAPAPEAPAAPPAATPAPAEPKKAFAKKEVKPKYTLEQLQDFDEFEHEGETYGRNVRGDVVNSEGEYAGHWDGTTVKVGAAPADWAKVMA
jgi:hypothetical protein